MTSDQKRFPLSSLIYAALAAWFASIGWKLLAQDKRGRSLFVLRYWRHWAYERATVHKTLNETPPFLYVVMKHTYRKGTGMKKNIGTNGLKLIAKGRGNDGMDIYALAKDGTMYYLMPHRRNNPLFYLLKDAQSMESLRRIKPARSNSSQKLIHSLEQVLKVAECFVKYEYAEAA